MTGWGAGGVTASLKALREEQDRLPTHARAGLHGIAAQLRALAGEIERLHAQTMAWYRNDEASRRLATIPGIANYLVGHCCSCTRRIAVPVRPALRRLTGAHTSTAKFRRQSSTGRDYQAKQRLSSPAARRWCNSGHAHGVSECCSPTMDGATARAQADQDRDGDAGQQDSPHCLGLDDAEVGLRRRRITRSRSRNTGVKGCVGAAQ